jgi:hypothetical protein
MISSVVLYGRIDNMNNRRRLISKVRRKILSSNRRRYRLKITKPHGEIKKVYDLYVTGIELKSDLEYVP